MNNSEEKPKKDYASGVTFVNHPVLDHLIAEVGLSKREVKVLLLIIRITYGCHRRWAEIRMIDYQVCGVGKNNIKKVLESLESKERIIWFRRNNEVRLTDDFASQVLNFRTKDNLDKLKKLIGRHLPRPSQIKNHLVSNTRTNELSDQEVSSSQFDNSDSHNLNLTKDTIKHTDKNTFIKDITSNEDSFKQKHLRTSNPDYFTPMNDTEENVLKSFRLLGDGNESFSYYIYAAKQLGGERIYTIAKQIANDPRARNKGTVFVSEVKKILEAEK